MIFTIFAIFASSSAWASPAADFLADLDLFTARSLTIRSERQQLSSDASASLSRLLQVTPRVSVGVGRAMNKESIPIPYEAYYNYWRASADWNLFRGGGDYFAWRAAKANERAQEFQVQSQELKTEFEGARIIFRRLYLNDVVGAQNELLKLKEETIRIGRSRYEQGKIPLQDVTKMEVDLSQQQNVVRQAQIDLAENESNYRAFFVEELKTRSWPFEKSQKIAVTDAEGKSFDQLRLEARAISLHEASKSAWTRHLPSLDFNLSFREYPLAGPGNSTWAGTLELSLPIWSRGEIAADAAQAGAASLRAENEAANQARQDELRRKFVREKVALSQKNLEEASRNLEKSDRLYRDMLRSFQLGRLSTNDLFIEQDRKIRALISFSESRLAFHESLIESCALWGSNARNCLSVQ